MIELKHVGIYVDNIEAVASFYTNVFDMTAICENLEDSNELLDTLLEYEDAAIIVTKLVTPKGKETSHGDMVELVKVIEGNETFKTTRRVYNLGETHIAFGVDNIQEIANRIIKNGGCMKTDIITRTNGRKFAFALDPEGNWIELIQ